MAPQSANSLRGTVGYSALSEGPQLRPGLARLALHRELDTDGTAARLLRERLTKNAGPR